MSGLVVWVCGVGGSGKSSSIRRYVESAGINLPSRPKDFFFSFKGCFEERKFVVGVSSAGDSEKIIDRNFNFFESVGASIIVCPTKNHGETVAALNRRIQNGEYELRKVIRIRVSDLEKEISWETTAADIQNAIDVWCHSNAAR